MHLFVILWCFGACLSAYGASDSAHERILAQEVMENYATMVHASYDDAYQRVVALQATLQTFVAKPAPASLEAAKKAWKQARIPYGQTEAFRKILAGLGTLSRGELAGERLAVALATRDQEDEQSCFSDNTHVDIIQNAQGIQNVYVGQYMRTNGAIIKGPGVHALLSADLKEAMTRQLQTTMAKVHAIEPPFDREIVSQDGRQRVQEAIDALRAQAELMVAIAKELDIPNLQVEVPE